MRVKLIYYYLPYCRACDEFERNVIKPLYKRGDIDLIKVNVETEREIRELRLPMSNVNHKLHYDAICRKSDCVVPAVEIVMKETEDYYESKFIFTTGDEKKFERDVINSVESISMLAGVVVY